MAKRPKKLRRPKSQPRTVALSSLSKEAARLATTGRLRDAIQRHVRDMDVIKEKDIDAVCKELFAQLRKNCPELLPQAPLKTGAVGPEIDLDPKSTSTLLASAGRKISDGESSVIWLQAGNELEVAVAKVQVKTEAGHILVLIPVRCDETGAAEVTVAFAVGSAKRPAGMIAVTNARPSGPSEVIEIWGDASIAFAWGAVIELMQGLAFEAGQDQDREGLIPSALQAGPNGLRLSTMARHRMDRRPK